MPEGVVVGSPGKSTMKFQVQGCKLGRLSVSVCSELSWLQCGKSARNGSTGVARTWRRAGTSTYRGSKTRARISVRSLCIRKNKQKRNALQFVLELYLCFTCIYCPSIEGQPIGHFWGERTESRDNSKARCSGDFALWQPSPQITGRPASAAVPDALGHFQVSYLRCGCIRFRLRKCTSLKMSFLPWLSATSDLIDGPFNELFDDLVHLMAHQQRLRRQRRINCFTHQAIRFESLRHLPAHTSLDSTHVDQVLQFGC